jgi:hypothetical protein
MPLMYSILTGIRSRSSIKVNLGSVVGEGGFEVTARSSGGLSRRKPKAPNRGA